MQFQVGYAKQDITPPAGVDLCGFGFYLQRKVTDRSEKLWCRAAYLASESGAVLLACCDLIGLSVADTDRLRKSLATQLGIPETHLFLACTHTHYGPATMTLEGLGAVDADYMEALEQAILDAALQAARNIQPATLRHGTREVDGIAYNRHHKAEAPLDKQLRALCCIRAQDTVCLASFACHPVSLGLEMGKTSADWPGAFAARLEARNIKPVVFQGCCGDVDPLARRDAPPDPQPEIRRYATLLDDALVRIMDTAEPLESPSLSVRELRFDLPLALPEPAEIEASKVAWQAHYEALAAGFDNIPNAARYLEHWAERARAALPALQARPALTQIPMQLLRIGPLELLGIPGEVFTEIGQRLQNSTSSRMLLGFCGGNVGYLPTREAYDAPFDYACYAAPKFYYCFPFHPNVADEVETAAMRLFAE